MVGAVAFNVQASDVSDAAGSKTKQAAKDVGRAASSTADAAQDKVTSGQPLPAWVARARGI